jgi:WD40 repeat protein
VKFLDSGTWKIGGESAVGKAAITDAFFDRTSGLIMISLADKEAVAFDCTAFSVVARGGSEQSIKMSAENGSARIGVSSDNFLCEITGMYNVKKLVKLDSDYSEIAMSSKAVALMNKGSIQILDLAGKSLRVIPFEGKEGMYTDVCFDPTGKYLVVCMTYNEAKVYSGDTFETNSKLSDVMHRDEGAFSPSQVFFSSDGDTAFAAVPGREMSFSLYGFDTPKKASSFGTVVGYRGKGEILNIQISQMTVNTQIIDILWNTDKSRACLLLRDLFGGLSLRGIDTP